MIPNVYSHPLDAGGLPDIMVSYPRTHAGATMAQVAEAATGRTTRVYESRTRANHFHTVTIYADGDVLCTCEAGRRGRMCWAAKNAVLTADAKPVDYAANRRLPWVEELDLIHAQGLVAA